MSCVSWLVDYQWSGQSSANIYEVFFFKDSYFATATAVIINVHFSITCLPLSYSSHSTTLCIITVTHCKSGGGQRVCACVEWVMCVCHNLTKLCVYLCVYAKCGMVWLPAFVCMSFCMCVSVCVRSLWAGFRVGVVSSVHQKLKPVRLPCFLMEPPDVIAANPSSCDLTQLKCP